MKKNITVSEAVSKVIAYIRVSTDKQTVENQENEINKYAITNHMIIDEFIRIEISGVKSQKKRKIDLLISKLDKGDTLIVSELSRLGRSTQDVLKVIDTILKKGVTIIFIKQNLKVSNDTNDMTSKVMITLFALFSELERDLISSRTKEALSSRKKNGQILGRKVGSLSKSKYDVKAVEIVDMFNLGASATSISRLIGMGSVKTLIEWKAKRVEHNDLLGGYYFTDQYKKFIISQKEKETKKIL